MSLFPQMTPFHYPSRATQSDESTPFFSLFNETFNELQRLSGNLPATQSGNSSFFAPKFDVKETPQAYELQGELPGITQKDIIIEFADEDTLTIKGRTEHRHEQGDRPTSNNEQQQQQQQQQQTNEADTVDAATSSDAKSNTELANTPGADKQQVSKSGNNDHHHTYWVSERSVGEFSRSFSFPNKVDQERVKASLRHGLLTVVVPKMSKQPPKTRRVCVEAQE